LTIDNEHNNNSVQIFQWTKQKRKPVSKNPSIPRQQQNAYIIIFNWKNNDCLNKKIKNYDLRMLISLYQMFGWCDAEFGFGIGLTDCLGNAAVPWGGEGDNCNANDNIYKICIFSKTETTRITSWPFASCEAQW
jgi:hypothetical protein